MEGTSDGEQVGVTYKQLHCHRKGSLWPDIQGPSLFNSCLTSHSFFSCPTFPSTHSLHPSPLPWILISFCVKCLSPSHTPDGQSPPVQGLVHVSPHLCCPCPVPLHSYFPPRVIIINIHVPSLFGPLSSLRAGFMHICFYR